MSKDWEDVTHLYDNKGNFLGVLIAADLWNKTKHNIAPILNAEQQTPEKILPEPLEDWKMLQDYWDFRYPVNLEVRCDICENETKDWEADEPRKFRLMACNLGGLMRFECQKCKATVTKRHFKDKIQCTCAPCDS